MSNNYVIYKYNYFQPFFLNNITHYSTLPFYSSVFFSMLRSFAKDRNNNTHTRLHIAAYVFPWASHKITAEKETHFNSLFFVFVSLSLHTLYIFYLSLSLGGKVITLWIILGWGTRLWWRRWWWWGGSPGRSSSFRWAKHLSFLSCFLTSFCFTPPWLFCRCVCMLMLLDGEEETVQSKKKKDLFIYFLYLRGEEEEDVLELREESRLPGRLVQVFLCGSAAEKRTHTPSYTRKQ